MKVYYISAGKVGSVDVVLNCELSTVCTDGTVERKGNWMISLKIAQYNQNTRFNTRERKNKWVSAVATKKPATINENTIARNFGRGRCIDTFTYQKAERRLKAGQRKKVRIDPQQEINVKAHRTFKVGH